MRQFLDLHHKMIPNSKGQRLMSHEHDSPEAEELQLPNAFRVRTLQPVKNSPEF